MTEEKMTEDMRNRRLGFGGKLQKLWDILRFLLFLLLLYGILFREPLETRGYTLAGDVLQWVLLFGIPCTLYLAVTDRTWRRGLIAGGICLVIFVLCGLAGHWKYGYQPQDVMRYGLRSSAAFWLWLVSFGALLHRFPLERFAKHLGLHVCALSAVMVLCTIADMRLWIWKRQIYRRGIGSIQIFYGHPSQFASALALLLLLLLVLMPYLKWISAVFALALQLPLYMTLRFRIRGFMLGTLILVIWFGLLKKKLKWWLIPAGLSGALLIGGRRLYDFYFSPYALTMARGQFAYNGIRIARDNFPFGTGFGTFGSRAAQAWYSPVYYWYEMCYTPGLDPLWPSYACDTFWPMILGETGVLGLAAYLGLCALLVYGAFDMRRKGEWAYTAALAALVFELLESTGTLALADPSAAGIALLFGLLFGMQGKGGDH